MRRREFIVTALGGAAAALPLGARAQQPAMPLVGFLSVASADAYSHLRAAFRQGLQAAGYIDGQNVSIEYRWADGRYDLLPSLAADLVRQPVMVIAATGGSAVARAAAGEAGDRRILGIGYTCTTEPVTAFIQRPRELGWIERRTIDRYRWAEGRSDSAEFAAEFV